MGRFKGQANGLDRDQIRDPWVVDTFRAMTEAQLVVHAEATFRAGAPIPERLLRRIAGRLRGASYPSDP